MLKNILKILIAYFVAISISTSSSAEINNNDKAKAWECTRIY